MPTSRLFKSLLASALLAAALFGGALAAAAPVVVDVKQGATLQNQGVLLIDVREAGEYAAGHAPGSVLIPLGQLQQRLPELAAYKDRPVVLVCRSGNRSEKALKLLEHAGFSAASHIDGGMIAWEKANLPMVSGAAPR